MKRRSIVLWLGVAVILVPFLGVPIKWKEYALVAAGVLIVTVAALPGQRSRGSQETNAAFAESHPTSPTHPL